MPQLTIDRGRGGPRLHLAWNRGRRWRRGIGRRGMVPDRVHFMAVTCAKRKQTRYFFGE